MIRSVRKTVIRIRFLFSLVFMSNWEVEYIYFLEYENFRHMKRPHAISCKRACMFCPTSDVHKKLTFKTSAFITQS